MFTYLNSAPTGRAAMSNKLTERQNQIYEFIRAHLQDQGIPPSVDEIRDRLGLASTSGVHKHLVALEKKGAIVRIPNVSRGIRLLGKKAVATARTERTAPALQIVPEAAAQQPSLLRRGRETLHVDLTLFPSADPAQCVVGEVGDDGMADEGILKLDYAVIEEAGKRPAQEGTLVAAFVEEELIVRRIAFTSSRIEFVPSARHYKPKSFVFGSQAYLIIGPVLTVIRRL